MSIRPIAHSPVLALLAGIAAIGLSGCGEVRPKLEAIDRDTATGGEQGVPFSVFGKDFTSNTMILIDGALNGGPQLAVGSKIEFFPPGELKTSLNVSLFADPGAHTVVVADASGLFISENIQYFFVRCPGCPPPPQLSLVSSIVSPGTDFLLLGSNPIVSFFGHNFLNNDPTVSFEGTGVTVDPRNLPGVVTKDIWFDRFDVRLIIAPDAGYLHKARVITKGGTSNPIEFRVTGRIGGQPTITGVTVAGSGCLEPGDNDLTIQGYNFDVGTVITVSYVDGAIRKVKARITDVQPNRILAQVTIPGVVAPGIFETAAKSVDGYGFPFSTVCSPVNRPLLRSVSPAVLTEGTTVNIKCEGDHFGQEDVSILVEEGKGVTVEEVLRPIAADPEHVRIVRLRIDAGAATPVLLSIKDSLGQASNTQSLTISAPSTPGVLSANPNSIEAGGDAEVEVRGVGLFAFALGSLHFSTPGLTISNATLSSTDFASFTFHVHADSSAPLTNDEATNLILGNPIAFKVLPRSMPTPTPTPAGPVLTRLTPSRVTRGTTVFVKCEGSNFGLAARVTAQGSAGSTTLRSRPVKADPDKVIVPIMGIGLSASPTIMVQVVDGQGKVSNALPLAVDDPVAGKPFLGDPSQGFVLLGGVRLGGDINNNSRGKNLQGINDQSWSFSFPGHLTFSSTVLDSSGQFVSFHVHADATTPLSADEATNLTVTTPAGQSNAVAFEVIR